MFSPFAGLKGMKAEKTAEEAKAQAEAARKVAAEKKAALEAELADAALTAQAERRAAQTAATRQALPGAIPDGDPMATYSEDDRQAFSGAFAGVTPLGQTTGPVQGKKKSAGKKGPTVEEARRIAARRAADEAEAKARARLDGLVAGATVVEVRRNEDGGVEGKRRGAPDRTVRMLAQGQLAPEARLDLHGLRRDQVSAAVNKFARQAHRDGRLTLSIIHGKGRNSEGGRGVLEDAVVAALKSGGAAPLVEAFATAPERFGGHGALVVRLRGRFR